MADAQVLVGAWLATGVDEDAAWASARQGPALETVASRLSAIPSPFLDPAVDVVALVRDAGIDGPLACAAHLDHLEVRRGAAVAVWLLASEHVVAPFEPALADGAPERLIDALALRLAPASDPLTWLADGERREEAARLALLWSGYLPARETREVARGHWDAVDSLRRNAALAKFAQEEEHRRAIAAKLADATAREATARYTRE